MKLKVKVILLAIMLVLNSSYNVISSQSPKPSRQSSMEAFSKGNYEQAYIEFRELLKIYPKDPLYKYYAGVSLIHLGRNADEAMTFLSEALESAAGIKSLPQDAMFYLGRAKQMKGDFIGAEEAYKNFSDLAGRKATKEKNVAEFIRQCREEKGKITVIEKIDEAPVAEIPKTEKMSPKESIPPDYDKKLDEALVLQKKADSLDALASVRKQQLGVATETQKSEVKAKMSESRIDADSLQRAADKKYAQAGVLIDTGKKSATIVQDEESAAPEKPKAVNKITDPVRKQASSAGTDEKKPAGVLFEFEVLPKPVTDPKQKIQINPEIPEGLVYRIQMAVFRNPVALSYFKGISPVYGFKPAGNDNTIYYAGMFRRSADASKALPAVKAKGFRDSFVVALLNGKSISSDRAKVIEKEWANKPLFEPLPEQLQELDTIPPTLTFRVEVASSYKPLDDEAVENFRKLAARRGLDIEKKADGSTAYLIGYFITFKSAEEYADLLVRNGYRDATVVARLGKREIDVETARKLFDNLK